MRSHCLKFWLSAAVRWTFLKSPEPWLNVNNILCKNNEILRFLFRSLSDKKLTVYNSSSVRRSVNNSTLLELSVKYFMLHPFDQILWRPRIFVTSSKFLYYFLTILQQVIPALLIDFVLRTTGQPQTM